MAIATELPINTSATADAMVQEIFGNGASVVSGTASYSGDALSSGIYSNANAVSPGVAPSDTGVILSTGYARDFTNSSGTTNTNVRTNTSTNTTGANNDADFNSLAGTSTHDAAFLEADFIPTGNVLTLDFVLASEEYPEWINSQYNDVAGVWVNGVQATVSVGPGTASIGNLNSADTTNLYVDNTGDQYNTEMDGFTITLSFNAPVTAGAVNHIKIGVADVADSVYDTNLLIAGSSVQTAIVAVDDSMNMGLNATKTIDVLGNDVGTGSLTVTKINDVAVNVGDSVTLTTGQVVTLNADGTLSVQGDGNAETVSFSYSIVDGAGLTDTGLVTVTQMACFAEGTLIETDAGDVPIEALGVGDKVRTLDNGWQTIRWIGSREAVMSGKFAPVLIKKGTFGATRDLRVSPQHRIMVRGEWAELMFGASEVLVRAIHLVNGRTVRWDAGPGRVRYFHMLFDQHEIVCSNGVLTESFHPGPETMDGFDRACQAEILELFPELDVHTGDGYGPSARPSLRGYEAKALLANLPA